MAHRIVTLPGDGIGPEIMAPTLELLRHARRVRVRGAPLRRGVDRRPRRGPHRRGARRLPERRRGAAGGRRRTQVGHDRSAAAPAGAGPARAAQGTRAVREPAPGQAAARSLRRLAAAARADRGHRPAGRARAHRRHLLRREDAHGDLGLGRVLLHHRGDRAHRPHRVQAARAERSRASTRPTCSRPRGCGARR